MVSAGEVARVTVRRSHTGHCDGRGGTNAHTFTFLRSVSSAPLSRARETPSRCEDTREKNATSLVTRREIRCGGELRLIVNGGESIAPASPTGKEER